MDSSPAAPDTKDWTWVLHRPCPECGEEVGTVSPHSIAGRLRSAALAWQPILLGPHALHVGERPQPLTWSPLEYAAHTRDVLIVAAGRIDLMTGADQLAGEVPVFADWDQDAAAGTGRYGDTDAADVAVALVAASDAVASRLEAAGDDDAPGWRLPGRRSNGSLFTVATFAQYVLHDIAHHLHDVTRSPVG